MRPTMPPRDLSLTLRPFPFELRFSPVHRRITRLREKERGESLILSRGDDHFSTSRVFRHISRQTGRAST